VVVGGTDVTTGEGVGGREGVVSLGGGGERG
jgi:hypothetical protein